MNKEELKQIIEGCGSNYDDVKHVEAIVPTDEELKLLADAGREAIKKIVKTKPCIATPPSVVDADYIYFNVENGVELSIK